MLRLFLVVFALAGWSGVALAQAPFIAYRGVLNAASLAPPGLPNAGLARGGVFTIFGSNLGPTTPATVSEFPLRPNFEGVTVSATQGGVTVSAIPIFVSANQLNVILTSNTPLGSNLIRVGYNGRLSNTIAVEVVENAPGIFAISSGGFGPGVVQNFVSEANQPVNSLDNAAARGQVITIWATGLGRVSFPDNVAPTPVNVEFPVTVSIGEREAPPLYAGRSPCCAGVDQIVVRVPDDAPLGCHVPLRLRSGTGVSNTVTLAIGAGPRCEDTFNRFSGLMRTARRQGLIQVTRTNSLIDSYNAATEANTTDAVRAVFLDRPASPFLFDPQYSYPPPGSCLLQQTSGNVFRGAPLRGTPAAASALDAGTSIRLATTSNGSAALPKVSLPQAGYAEVAGSLRGSDGVGPLKVEFFNTTRVEGTGGTVGAFTANINATNLFTWTERPTLDRIRRTNPLRVSFLPNDPTAPTELALVAYSAAVNASVALTCLIPPQVQSFAVPVDLLSQFPPSGNRLDGSFAMIGLGVVPLERAVPFTAPGLDGGLAVFSQWFTRSTYIQ